MKLRRIGIAALSLALMATLASCGGGTRKNILMADENLPEVKDDGKDYVERLSSSTVDHSQAKKIFYTGDEFTSEGLKVTLNYRKYNKSTGAAMDGIVSRETTQYSVNAKEVNLSKVGKYPVIISVRVGTKIEEATYTVEVRSSLLESTPGTVYIGGIDLEYKTLDDNTTKLVKTSLLDDPITVSPSDLKYTIHKRTVTNEMVDGKYVIEDEVITDVDTDKISFVTDKIDNANVGTYMVTMKYDNGDLSVGGTTYHNDVTSYVLVDIVNPATKIEFIDGTTIFEATLSDMDLSDWKVKITREKREPVIVDYSNDLFEIGALDEFKWNSPQKITVYLKENIKVKTEVNINIRASKTYDITKYENLTKGDAVEDDFVKLAGTDFIFINKEVSFTARESGKDKYGSLNFLTRIAAKSESQSMKIVMDKPGQIAFFVASSTDGEARAIYFLDENKEELASKLCPGSRAVTKFIVDCPKAGTYYLSPSDGSMWIHGLVVAKQK